jgi:hypothetical protein
VRPAAGRGAPGAFSVAARGASELGGAIGWRGPERICPGLGAGGAGLAGIGIPRGAMGGVSGGPDDNGGRNGAERVGAGAWGAACSAGISRACTGASTAATGSGLAATGAEGASIGAASGVCSATCPPDGEASAVADPLSPSISRRLISIATGSSIELEWVFFSVTPRTGSKSRITLGLTSSSRASSLMRILIIPCAPSSTSDTGVVCFSPAPFPKSPRLPGTVQYLS